MSVVDEIMAQGSHTAFRIAKDLLDRLENDLHKFAIAAVHKETIGVAKAIKGEPAEIMLVAEPDPDYYGQTPDWLDEGCDFGCCEECQVHLMCSHKEVLCPLCRTKTHLT